MEVSLFLLILFPYLYFLVFHKLWKKAYSTWIGISVQVTSHGLFAWFCWQLLVLGPIMKWDATSRSILFVLGIANCVLLVGSSRRAVQ